MGRENLKQKAIKSAKSMIDIAENAVKYKHNLQKVVLLEHHPRFDCQTKSELAKVANSTMHQLLSKSACKQKIEIRRHSLESFGIGHTHNARYSERYTGRYDGLHLFGPTGARDYTNSLVNIFKLCKPKPKSNCESGDSAQGHVPVITIGSHSPIPTKNRFEVLSQGN